MIFKQPIFAVAAVCLGLNLGACAQVSGNVVADHWPHWAGGEPANTPPRPGSPGYQDYIAHRQAEGSAPPTATGSAPAAPAQGRAAVSPPPAQSSNPAPNGDTAVAKSGLY